MEPDLEALRRRVVDQLRPKYQTSLRRGRAPDEAYETAYAKAVDALAKATKMSPEKTRFESRNLLQEIMNEVSRG